MRTDHGLMALQNSLEVGVFVNVAVASPILRRDWICSGVFFTLARTSYDHSVNKNFTASNKQSFRGDGLVAVPVSKSSREQSRST